MAGRLDPFAAVHGGPVGAVSVLLAVAAHGIAGGGLLKLVEAGIFDLLLDDGLDIPLLALKDVSVGAGRRPT